MLRSICWKFFLYNYWFLPHFLFCKLFCQNVPSPFLFSNPKVFFQKQYTASAIRSKMTLVNVVPNGVLHQKMHVSGAGIFLGESKGLPAPCVGSIYSSDSFTSLIVNKNMWTECIYIKHSTNGKNIFTHRLNSFLLHNFAFKNSILPPFFRGCRGCAHVGKRRKKSAHISFTKKNLLRCK